jgi:hypothetical protein
MPVPAALFSGQSACSAAWLARLLREQKVGGSNPPSPTNPSGVSLGMDQDLDEMSREQLVAEVLKLRGGIRKHRDAEGHSLCWYVPELWGLLPERLDPKPKVPPVGEFLENCAAYRASLDDALVGPTHWVPGRGLVFIDSKYDDPGP